jgi:hypothetical protein
MLLHQPCDLRCPTNCNRNCRKENCPPALEAQPQSLTTASEVFLLPCYPAHEDRKIVSWAWGLLYVQYLGPLTVNRKGSSE